MIAYSFHPEAEDEFRAAAEYYEARRVGLGKSFSAEVEHTIKLIRQFPDAGSPVQLPRRRVLVDRFPYSVVYRREPDRVVIVAVVHAKRRPGYWRHRK